MSNGYFDFKQFRVRHDRCAMKVGTDAVLLGAWADLEGRRRILDLGCGSGVIALMAAQRQTEAEVVGVDIDEVAVGQARENAAASSFAARCSFCCCDVRDFYDEAGFDCILSNPPFYTEDTLPPDALRSVARNSSLLPFRELVTHARRLMREGGQLHVVLPTLSEPAFTECCLSEGLLLVRACRVHTTSRKESKRILCTYSLSDSASGSGLSLSGQYPCYEKLVLMENGARTEEYARLTGDFYLDVPRP